MKKLLFIALSAAAFAAQAATLNLQESVTVEVPQDELTAAFYIEFAGTSHVELNNKASDVLRRAAAASRPDIKVTTTSINTYPVYDSKGKTNQYKVRASVEVKSTKIGKASEVANELAGFMAFERVSYAVSDATKKKVRDEQATSVAVKFMEKANTVATALGYQKAVVDNIGLDLSAATNHPPPIAMRHEKMAVMSMSSNMPDMQLGGGAGVESITTIMTGTVHLK